MGINEKYFLIEYRAGGVKIGTRADKDAAIKSSTYSSVSAGYDSVEELKEKLRMTGKPCSCCGVEWFSTNYHIAGDEMREKNICFGCHFWSKRLNLKGKQRIIINHQYYSVGTNNNVLSKYKGHGGAKWVIKMKETGEIIRTDNLWHGGEIPEHFRDKLPDNAELMDDKFY